MPTPIIPESPDAPEARRQYIRSAISFDTWQNESGASILRSLRDSGWSIRTQDFYDIRREKLNQIDRIEKYKELYADDLVPYQMMKERGDLYMTKNAQYRLAMTVIDPASGKEATVYRSIASDQHFTQAGIESLAGELFTSGGEGYNYQITAIDLQDVWIQPGARLEW